MDQIEQALIEIRDKLGEVWRHHNCTDCPMGELAALAGALVEFYRINTPANAQPQKHWSQGWKRDGTPI